MYSDRNPYYSPLTWDFEIFGTLDDPEADWSFDYVVVWKDLNTGSLYGAQDSGCSCPTPFEDVHTMADLVEIRAIEDFNALAATSRNDTAEEQALRRKVELHLRRTTTP